MADPRRWRGSCGDDSIILRQVAYAIGTLHGEWTGTISIYPLIAFNGAL